jgi:chemotaxis protein methyltransferase CheR
LGRRINELGLSGLSQYRALLEDNTREWSTLDSLCRITISRFYRDRGVFDALGADILPSLARDAVVLGEDRLNCWCAGCCSGEEPYTLQIIWHTLVQPQTGIRLPLRIVATDTDPVPLERARSGLYGKSSLRDLPEDLSRMTFRRKGQRFAIRSGLANNIDFLEQDIRKEMPSGPFRLILCRNLAFTYFDEMLQAKVLEQILKRLVQGGVLVTGANERLPEYEDARIERYDKCRGIYRKP